MKVEIIRSQGKKRRIKLLSICITIFVILLLVSAFFVSEIIPNHTQYIRRNILTEEFATIKKNSHHTQYVQDQMLTEEFTAIRGNWMISQYLGKCVESMGAMAITEDEIADEENYNKILQEKYLGTILKIFERDIAYFCPANDSQYYIKNWDELFMVYRQSLNTINGKPPFLCASFKLKSCQDNMHIILDKDENATLVIKGRFFQLERDSIEPKLD